MATRPRTRKTAAEAAKQPAAAARPAGRQALAPVDATTIPYEGPEEGRFDYLYRGFVIDYTREHNNSVLLIAYLRELAVYRSDHQPRIDARLATLIADILEGRVRATKKRFTAFNPRVLMETVAATKAALKNGDEEAIRLARALGQELGTSGEIAKAAMAISAKKFGLTPSALDARMFPRAGRGKKG